MTATRRRTPHRLRDLTRALGAPAELRYALGSMHGQVYRALRRHPDVHVGDDVLADRVRSQIGSLVKDLDLPRIHVQVVHGIASLHGEVGAESSAGLIATTVARVAGIRGARSHLTVGLLPGDTRPSAGQLV